MSYVASENRCRRQRRGVGFCADFQRLDYELTPDAIDLGLNAALPPILELTIRFGEFGRGERDSPFLTQPPAGFLLINRTRPRAESSGLLAATGGAGT
jgi:hypothetical protein